MKRIISVWCVLVALFFPIILTTIAFADTEVFSIAPSPNFINPFNNESTTITVEATPGVTTLEIRVLYSDQSTVVRSELTLTETGNGLYTTTWNGRSTDNALVLEGEYLLIGES